MAMDAGEKGEQREDKKFEREEKRAERDSLKAAKQTKQEDYKPVIDELKRDIKQLEEKLSKSSGERVIRVVTE
jgi:predicted  nucleic acid-binding Zn-ribbon protein